MTTWALDPEAYSMRVGRRVLSTDAVDGAVLRRRTNSAVSDYSELPESLVFVLEWQYANYTDWQTVNGYLDDTYGGALPLDFTPPQGSTAIPCRIVSFRHQSVSPSGEVQMSVTLEEVI